MSERVARFTVSRALNEEFRNLSGTRRDMTLAFRDALDEVLAKGEPPKLKDPRPGIIVHVSRRLTEEQWDELHERAEYFGDMTRWLRGAGP